MTPEPARSDRGDGRSSARKAVWVFCHSTGLIYMAASIVGLPALFAIFVARGAPGWFILVVAILGLAAMLAEGHTVSETLVRVDRFGLTRAWPNRTSITHEDIDGLDVDPHDRDAVVALHPDGSSTQVLRHYRGRWHWFTASERSRRKAQNRAYRKLIAACELHTGINKHRP